VPAPVILSTSIPGLRPFIRGKVRDVYDLGDRLLMIATDRISAFDAVLPTGIPDKGKVLNQLSAFWFRQLAGVCPNHFVTAETEAIGAAIRDAGGQAPEEEFAGRSMLVRRTGAVPFECVVRGYLEGSAWKEYGQSGSVCGIFLPSGLVQGSRLPEPVFTPATKAQTGHDINISQAEMEREFGTEASRELADLSLRLYSTAAAYALEHGIIIADTKFEFGLLDGEPLLIDEALTPDSSRFWDAATYAPGRSQQSLDKQFVRDYLDRSGWNREPPAPELPEEVVIHTAERYREIHRRLTGAELGEWSRSVRILNLKSLILNP
jgi:phosphoribosylaminoimidazole-succinocarboxamide synthase